MLEYGHRGHRCSKHLSSARPIRDILLASCRVGPDCNDLLFSDAAGAGIAHLGAHSFTDGLLLMVLWFLLVFANSASVQPGPMSHGVLHSGDFCAETDPLVCLFVRHRRCGTHP